MKKMIVSTIVVCLMLVGCNAKDEAKAERIEIGVEDVLVKFEQKDSFILLLTRKQCGFCEGLIKVIDQNPQMYDVPIYNVVMRDDTMEHLNEDINKLKPHLEKPDETPHYYQIVDGKMVAEGKGFLPQDPLAFFAWLDKVNKDKESA